MQRFAGALFLIGAFFLAGTSVIAGRIVAGILGTFTIAAASLFFAQLGLVPLCSRRLGETLRRMLPRDWLRLLLQALFGIFLFRLFLLRGLILTSASEAGILTGATPAMTALLARFFLKEPLYKVRVLGLVCTVSGIVVIEGVFLPNIEFSRDHILGNLMVLAAATSESLFNILSRIYSITLSKLPMDSIVQTTLVAGMAFFLCLGPALAEHPVVALMSLSLIGWLALAWYGLFVTALAFIFWFNGIRRCEASVAAAFSGMMPFAALLLSILVLNEQPTWQQWLGGIMVVLGMLLTGREKGNDTGMSGHHKKSWRLIGSSADSSIKTGQYQ